MNLNDLIDVIEKRTQYGSRDAEGFPIVPVTTLEYNLLWEAMREGDGGSLPMHSEALAEAGWTNMMILGRWVVPCLDHAVVTFDAIRSLEREVFE